MEITKSHETGSQPRYQPRTSDMVRIAIRRDRTCEDCPHFPGEAERVGRIVRAPAPSFAPSHPYLILFADPCFIETRFSGRLAITARHYAADELEPLGD